MSFLRQTDTRRGSALSASWRPRRTTDAIRPRPVDIGAVPGSLRGRAPARRRRGSLGSLGARDTRCGTSCPSQWDAPGGKVLTMISSKTAPLISTSSTAATGLLSPTWPVTSSPAPRNRSIMSSNRARAMATPLTEPRSPHGTPLFGAREGGARGPASGHAVVTRRQVAAGVVQSTTSKRDRFTITP